MADKNMQPFFYFFLSFSKVIPGCFNSQHTQLTKKNPLLMMAEE
jgi:hypothetical protein